MGSMPFFFRVFQCIDLSMRTTCFLVPSFAYDFMVTYQHRSHHWVWRHFAMASFCQLECPAHETDISLFLMVGHAFLILREDTS